MITAVFRNSEFATTLFQVLRCIPIYLTAIPIPPETHILFYYIPFLFLVYTIVTFPSAGIHAPQIEQHNSQLQKSLAMPPRTGIFGTLLHTFMSIIGSSGGKFGRR
jgi:hypothetical protein